MKNLVLVLLACVLLNLPVQAVEEQDYVSVISAKGSAKTEVKPDTATVTIAVESNSKKLQAAIDENNEVSEKINARIKEILGEGDTIKTTSYQVNPVYTYDKSFTPPNKLTGYRVINQIKIKTGDISKLGEIIEVSLASGANRVSGLSYEVSDTDKVCKCLLKKAAQDARAEADILANSLGVKIKGIKKVSSSCNDRQVRPYMMESFARGMGDAVTSTAPALEAGESTINAQVFVDFIIE